MRQPGTLERTWSGMPAGIGMGGLMMGNFMSTIAGVMVGSMIADAFLGNAGYNEGSAAAADAPPIPPGPRAATSRQGIPGSATGHSATSAISAVGDFGGGDF